MKFSFTSLFAGKNNNDEELISKIRQGAFLVDVREPAELNEGSVEKAVNIPLGSILNDLKVFQNKTHIIFFCRSGNRSAKAKEILNQNGFANVSNGGTWNYINKLIKIK